MRSAQRRQCRTVNSKTALVSATMMAHSPISDRASFRPPYSGCARKAVSTCGSTTFAMAKLVPITTRIGNSPSQNEGMGRGAAAVWPPVAVSSSAP